MKDITGKDLLEEVVEVAKALERKGHTVALYKETYEYTKAFVDGWAYDIQHSFASVDGYVGLIERFIATSEQCLTLLPNTCKDIDRPKYKRWKKALEEA